jgi:hypothetical protein
MSPPTGIPLARHVTRTPSSSGPRSEGLAPRIFASKSSSAGQARPPDRGYPSRRSRTSAAASGPGHGLGRPTGRFPIVRGSSSPDYTRSCRSGLMSPRSQRVHAASPIDCRLARGGRRPRNVAHGSCDPPVLQIGWITRSGVGPRRHARPSTDEAGRVHRRGSCLRSSGSSAEPDRPLGSKPTDGRAGRVLPVFGLVRGSGAWIEVRPARQVRARAGPARPRSDGEHRRRWDRVGRSHRDHARASPSREGGGAGPSRLHRERLNRGRLQPAPRG